ELAVFGLAIPASTLVIDAAVEVNPDLTTGLCSGDFRAGSGRRRSGFRWLRSRRGRRGSGGRRPTAAGCRSGGCRGVFRSFGLLALALFGGSGRGFSSGGLSTRCSLGFLFVAVLAGGLFGRGRLSRGIL